MSAERLVLAVEGGGTKTDALLALADGTELARARGGPGNFRTIGSEAMTELLAGLLDELGRKAGGHDIRGLAVASLAVAGCESKLDAGALRKAAQSAGLKGRIVVSSDARATLQGACGGEGVLVIAGTGSIVYGRDASGAERRAGGWGRTFGDEGSAYDLGRQALGLTSRMVDGRHASCLLGRRVLASLGVPENGDARDALLELLDQVGPIARLAPLAVAAAEEGDAAALGLVDAGAGALVEGVLAVASGLELPEGFSVALYGGLFEHCRFYTERFQKMLRPVWPRAAAAAAPAGAGLRGALSMALRELEKESAG